jgi:hypothetical protein
VTTVPINLNIIDLVHQMADNDNMSDGLKIETKPGLILYNSACIAGVDYQENDDNDSVYSQYEDNVNGNEMNPNDILEINDEVNNQEVNPTEIIGK